MSHPVASPFTLSGPVTYNFWAAQTGPAGVLNAGFVTRLYKLSSTGALTLVANDSASGEVVGGNVLKTWVATPTPTAFAKGDRIVVFIGMDDAGGTMSSGSQYPPGGQSLIFITDSGIANTVGDTWLQLSETVTFNESLTYSGSKLYLTDAASSVSVGSSVDEKVMWTAPGTAERSATRDTVAGPVPIASQQWKVAPGGNTLEWYSLPLNAFSLSGSALVSLWGEDGQEIPRAVFLVELAVVNYDGSNAQVWGRALLPRMPTSVPPGGLWGQVAATLSGPDVAVSAGQRLRLRLFMDDHYGYGFCCAPLASGQTAAFYYNGTSEEFYFGNASYIKLAQSVSESTGPPPPPPPSLPATGLLDNFNRGGNTETPVSQGGMWAATGAHGGLGAPLSQDRLQNFAQPSYSYRVTPYVGGDMESWVTIQSRPNQNHWLSLLICLQDAGTAGWDGYELRATVQSGPDRWEILRVTDGAATGIASTTMEIAAGGTMLFRRSGVDLRFWWKPAGGAWTQKLSVGNSDYMWGMIGVGGYKTGTLDDFGGGSLLSLLEQYLPELRFDTLEGYRADSAAMMTDSYVPGDHSNELRDSQDAVLAASDPAIPTPATPLPLSLNYLATYSNPQVTHKIREAPGYKADADRMRAQPQYANKVYARIFNYNGVIALQYWFFYYYNPKTFYFVGNHEGDWESITVLLNSNGTQVGAAYSQHSYGETCAWPRVEKTFEGRPKVYVGEGSHASYFTSSPTLGHPVYYPDIQAPPVATDNVDGLGVPGPLIPSVIDITNLPAWMNWPGRWGASGNSPPGPPVQGFKWDNPVLWAFSSTDQLQCRTSALASRQQSTQTTRTREDHTLSSTLSATNLGLPPAPTVRARLVGRKAVIDYRFKSFPTERSRRPWMLVTSVVSASPRYTPYTVRTRVTDRSGRVIQRRGAGPGPYKLRVATLSAVGTRSQIIQVPLKVASG